VLRRPAAFKVVKWVGRGLDRVLLAKIRTDVFNIGEPALK
jgi:hypothetical protein